MTVEQAREINLKIAELRDLYPELNLTCEVTFSKDLLCQGEHNVYITIQNGPVSAQQQVEFCKKNHLPYAKYVDGEFKDNGEGTLDFGTTPATVDKQGEEKWIVRGTYLTGKETGREYFLIRGGYVKDRENLDTTFAEDCYESERVAKAVAAKYQRNCDGRMKYEAYRI